MTGFSRKASAAGSTSINYFPATISLLHQTEAIPRLRDFNVFVPFVHFCGNPNCGIQVEKNSWDVILNPVQPCRCRRGAFAGLARTAPEI